MALALWAALSAVLALPADAQVVRGFTPRYTVNRTGAISLIGNTLVTCSPTGNNALIAPGHGMRPALIATTTTSR
jgi:hypothetical protein